MTHQLRFAARSDRGLLRSNNQDSVYAGERLLVVADGMGGHAAGDLASRVVVAAFVPLDENPPGADLIAPLRRAMDAGNDAIADLVAEDPELDGMGTTATALLFDGPRMGLAHIGDSRAYLYRNGVLHQLSHDDTFVQSLVDDGRITEDEAAHHPQRNLLLRALNGSEPEPMLVVREISVGDRFLICSDGLSGVVSAEAIADTLAGTDTDRVADTLIELALIGGGPDNVTVIVADVLDVGPEPAGVPAGHDPEDPEATGPLLPIHMTQRMPRVPLPVLSDEEAAERAAAQRAMEHGPHEDDEDDDDTAGAVDGLTSPPDRPRWRRRTALALALVVLLGVAITGSLLWVRTQYYVGAQNGQVVVFRGVDGSVLGVQLSSVAENSCPDDPAGCVPLQLSDLVPAARNQVNTGITAGSLADARSVMQRLTGQMLPTCDSLKPTPTPTPITTPTSSPPVTSPSPITSPTSTSPSPITSSRATTGSSASSPSPSGPSRTPAASPRSTIAGRTTARTTAPRTTAPRSTPRTTDQGAAANSSARASELARSVRAAASSAASVADAARAAATTAAGSGSTSVGLTDATSSGPASAATSAASSTGTPTTGTSSVVPPATTTAHEPVPGVDCR